MPRELRPTLTMSDIYGPGHIFISRAHDEFCDWLPNEPHQLDSFTGGQLVIAGDMPVVCSAGFDTPAATELLARTGLEMSSDQIRFRAGEDVIAVSRALERPDARLVLQHSLPDDIVPAARCWIDPELLRYLNNKANLAELVLAENLPDRRVVDRARYFAESSQQLPAVLKAASDQSSGGGCAVMICRTSEDVQRAARLFQNCELIVVEQLLDIVRNPCLNFAVMPNGKVRYFGFADQDLTPEGKYRGNWLALYCPIFETAVEAAAEPVRRAASMGYRGIAGVDIALTADGRTYALDLNFRTNGCTTPLLVASAVREWSGAAVMHFRKLEGSPGADQLARDLLPYVEARQLVPLALFDPALAGYPDKRANVQALIVGASREEVLATEAELAADGIG